MIATKQLRAIKLSRSAYLSLVLLCCYRLRENVH